MNIEEADAMHWEKYQGHNETKGVVPVLKRVEFFVKTWYLIWTFKTRILLIKNSKIC